MVSIEEIEKKLSNKPKEYREALVNFLDPFWRLNNLYYILNDEGFKVKFEFNDAQKWLWENKHTWNLVLKARQLGFTTLIDLYILDQALFTPDIECAIICHSREDAQKILRRKIKFPYNNLPLAVKSSVRMIKDSESEVMFSNGSVISTGTSARSGTLQILHVSEFAKICAKYPEKAREVVTGSFETLAPGQELFIESTAEGREGYFFDYCERARQRALLKAPLSPQEFKFHFFAWWLKPSNRLPAGDDLIIPIEMQEYFEGLENKHRIYLDRDQKFWYLDKKHLLGEDIKREHPSTAEEAFEESIKGSYFVNEFNKIYSEKRITKVPIENHLEVNTAWDLGMSDSTAIWFFQVLGKEIRLIDYYEDSGEGFSFYKDLLDTKGYRYGKHLGPHDLAVREMGTGKTRLETADQLGISFTLVPKVQNKADSIQAARTILNSCWFDAERCNSGIVKLQNYRREWNDKLGTYMRNPRSDENCHAADAFQCLAMGWDMISRKRIVRPIRVNNKKRWQAMVAG